MGEDRASWELEVGDVVVPGWRVAQPLGGGKVTEVFLVTATDDHERRAVAKVARPGTDRSGLASLEREVRHLRAVAHPSVPALVADGTRDERPHLVIEHVAGTKLSTRVRLDGPMGPEEAARVGAAVADALVALHEAGIAHLDVKPGNIVLGRPASLVDLGIARDLTAARRLKRPVGTRRWMAPEQRDPQAFGGMDARTDVWGLGASLFLALTGRGPIDHLETAPRTYEVTPRDVADLFLTPGTVPADLADVVLACLTWEPADRPTVEAVRGALVEHLGVRRRGRDREG